MDLARRALHAAFMFALATSCSSSNAERRDTHAASSAETKATLASVAEEMRLSALRMQQAQKDAEAQCSPLAGRAVPPAEEHAVGAAVARAFTGHSAAATDKLGVYVQKVGSQVAAHAARSPGTWSFQVFDDPQKPTLASTVGGYVFISTRVLARLKNEAQLAALLAREVAHVSSDWLVKYDSSRVQMCRIALTGFAMAAAGASDIPGGPDFAQEGKFGRSFKKLADPKGLDVEGEDAEFVTWYAGQFMEQQMGMFPFSPDQEERADDAALELLTAAGYDSGALLHALKQLEPDTPRHWRLEKKPPHKGKTPPFPKDVPMPKDVPAPK
jgi:predicted Zn-dependent protease